MALDRKRTKWIEHPDCTVDLVTGGTYHAVVGLPGCNWPRDNTHMVEPGANAKPLQPYEFVYVITDDDQRGWIRPGIVCDSLDEAKATVLAILTLES